VKVVDLAAVTDRAKLDAAFSAADPKLQFNPAKTPQLHLQVLNAKGDKFPRIQVWAQPAGEGQPSGKWTQLLSADSRAPDKASEVTFPFPGRIGFTSYAGASAAGKTACGMQVVALHVHSYERSQGSDDKAYLSGLQGQASEASIQQALKGISEDFKTEYGKHSEVMAQTREQLQKLEKQVAQMETKVDGFSFDGAKKAATDTGSSHGLLHAFKEAKAFVLEESDKMKAELEQKAKVDKKGDQATRKIELVVENLDKAVERSRSSSTWSLLFFLVLACAGSATVYSKMRTYEKRHHL
jgi:polyhydroxyalkanoate synthesis regulator phasin